jgi:hypothetical protein
MDVGKSFVPNVSSLLLEQCSQTCNIFSLGALLEVAVASMSNLEEASMIDLNTHTNPQNSHKTSPLRLSYNTTESLEFVDPPCFICSPVDEMNHGTISSFL